MENKIPYRSPFPKRSIRRNCACATYGSYLENPRDSPAPSCACLVFHVSPFAGSNWDRKMCRTSYCIRTGPATQQCVVDCLPAKAQTEASPHAHTRPCCFLSYGAIVVFSWDIQNWQLLLSGGPNTSLILLASGLRLLNMQCVAVPSPMKCLCPH